MSLEIASYSLQKPVETGRVLDFFSPFDGARIGRVHQASLMNLVPALAPAKKAQAEASEISFAERAVWFEKAADRVSGRAEWFASQEASFEGLSTDFVLRKSIRPMIQFLREIASELRAGTGAALKPVGLVAVIAPAGLAFRSIGERLIPALAAGNAVFVKVPSKSPVAALLWNEALADVPAGLVSLWVGSGPEIGQFLVSHPSIRAVTFAGRPATAEKVIAAGAPGLKKLQISAGVKNSLLLLPETDPSHFPQIFESLIMGQGRLGWGMSRIFVTEGEMPVWTQKLTSAIAELQPLLEPGQKSPWSPSSLEPSAWNQLVQQSKADQAKELVGGETNGNFTRPLLVSDLTNCSVLQLDELRSPFFILNSVRYAHEMVKWTNTGDFGFCASIWGPAEKAARLGAKLDVGQVWINGWLESVRPFAGLRKSFFGNPDFRWDGSFFSDVKTLMGPRN